LLTNWSAVFVVDDECQKFRMKETTNEMASIILSLNLGSTKTPIEEYVQLEDIVPFACISSMWDSCC
jgi:hypothetical protein